MRAPTAYYLMLLYLTVMLKPLVPVCTDNFAHAFAEAQHIAKVHAIYGANHLERKIADMQPKSSGNKDQNTLSQSFEVPFHIGVFTDSNVVIPHQQPPTYLLFIPVAFINIILPLNERPPRFRHVPILHKG